MSADERKGLWGNQWSEDTVMMEEGGERREERGERGEERGERREEDARRSTHLMVERRDRNGRDGSL
jgi:hypothetical protein